MKNKGFTLVEMLIVVAIIGILSSMVIVGLGSARAKARDSRRISDIRQIQNALEIYYSENRNYPEKLSDIFSSSTPPLVDPLDSSDYLYARSTDNQGYNLAACLEQKNIPGISSSTCSYLNKNCSSGTHPNMYCVTNPQ